MQVRKWLISGEINYNVSRICSLTLLPPEVLIPTPITLSVSVSDTGGPSVVSAVSSVAPVGSAASAVTPSFQIVPAVSVLQPAGYRSPIDSSDKDDQTIGTVDTASDLFADRACAKAGYQGPRPGCQERPGWLT